MKTATVSIITGAMLLAIPSLEAAQVDIVRNNVKSGPGNLRQGASLAPGSTLTTGSKSKTQVTIGAHGSLARAGSKTDLVLQNDSSLTLRQGIMLASSGKRTLGRESVVVDTPEVKSSVKGTMLIAYQPDVFVKITCIEGSVTVKLKALLGEFVRLRAGQMVIIDPASKTLPQEVEVDLRELSATSGLLGADFPALNAAPGLERAVARQDKGIGQGEMLRTPLVLEGAGLTVTLQTDAGVDPRRAVDPGPDPESPPPPPLRNPDRNGGGHGGEGGGEVIIPPNPPVISEYIIDGTTVFSPTTNPTLQTPGFPLVTADPFSFSAGFNYWTFPDADPVRTPELLFRGRTDIPAGMFDNGNEFSSEGNLQVGDGNPTSVFYNDSLGLLAAIDLDVTGTTIGLGSASPAFSPTGLYVEAGRVLSVRNSVLQHPNSVELFAPTVMVSGSSLEAGSMVTGVPGQSSTQISIESNGSSAATGSITITDSSILQALAQGSALYVGTNGSPITIANSALQANVIDLDTLNQAADGLIEIRNSTLSGDVIRARAFNTGDRDAILIRDSAFNANQLIQFYAEGASRLRFQGTNNLVLGANGVANLAGRTVQVDSGGNVNISGNGNVFRDVDNYNKDGFGNINISRSASHQPYRARP